MATAKVLYIYTAPTAGAKLEDRDSVTAVPGKGLEGDRYATLKGHYSEEAVTPDREVTLIEAETIEALRGEHGIDVHPSQTRRNIVTRGIALNALVGADFRVGEVAMRGVRLCEPCAYLQDLLGIAGLLKALVKRGGLRAQIVSEGTIRIGDPVGE
jgi:MOSC domain-containing protein YiiM